MTGRSHVGNVGWCQPTCFNGDRGRTDEQGSGIHAYRFYFGVSYNYITDTTYITTSS